MLLLALSAIALSPLCADNLQISALKEELGLNRHREQVQEACHLILVHHGDTDWTIQKKLQGWTDISLNETGRIQMQELSQQLANIPIAAIYSSDLTRAVESARIIAQGHDCDVILTPELKGEDHGTLDGLIPSEYRKDPHYIQYKQLNSEERIFSSLGEAGESKADVARRAIPYIRQIAEKHPGETVVIVTHGGVLKFINFLLGNYTAEEIDEVPHGRVVYLDYDAMGVGFSGR